jgi:predicted flavoprotein YhiN
MRAAEVIASRNLRVVILDQKPSPGRKFLVAGRGGLNITHSEPIEDFVTRYDAPEQWRRLL